MNEFEFGIRMRGEADPHRVGMTEEQARTWLAECDSLGIAPGLFHVIKRPLGEWRAA